ncbi:hypothetical protein JTB14_004347 [Gonioctena quinquepunctata]|nr:hypothetical protein JTB14_004347 [Gonioctena quinquepunctata]
MMKNRDRVFLDYKRKQTGNSWNYYKELRNFVNVAMKAEKITYLIFKSKTNPWEFWKALDYLNIKDKESHILHEFDIPYVGGAKTNMHEKYSAREGSFCFTPVNSGEKWTK